MFRLARTGILIFLIVLFVLVITDKTGALGTLDQLLRKMSGKKLNRNKIVTGAAKVRALDAEQEEAVELLAAEFEKIGDGDPRKLAYILATVDHESGFRPIEERRCAPDQTCYQLQEKYWHTGYFGRGYVQLTWQSNYEKFSKILGVDLVANPALALEPEIAAKIAIIGMIEGRFTGKQLSDYFTAYRTDWSNARKIVNNDTWNFDKIGALAQQYYKAIT